MAYKKTPAGQPAGVQWQSDLGPGGAFLRLVYTHRAINNLGVVDLIDCGVALILTGHFNEAETAGAAGFLVFNHLGRGHFAERLKRRTQIIVSSPEREIPNVYFHSIINSMYPELPVHLPPANRQPMDLRKV